MRDATIIGAAAAGQTCADCRHSGMRPNPDNTLQMVCKRYPPQMHLQAFPQGNGLVWVGNTAFPHVTKDEGCTGEFSPRFAS